MDPVREQTEELAPNGLPLRPLHCRNCGRHIANEAVERGYIVKKCPHCKHRQVYYVDRTTEPRATTSERALTGG